MATYDDRPGRLEAYQSWHGEVEVAVSGYKQRISKNGKAYTVYLVRLDVAGKSKLVYKRYSQFDQLRKAIAKECPEYKQPAFPGKKLLTSQDLDVIDERRYMFDKYMKALLAEPGVSTSEAVLSWFDGDDDDDSGNGGDDDNDDDGGAGGQAQAPSSRGGSIRRASRRRGGPGLHSQGSRGKTK